MKLHFHAAECTCVISLIHEFTVGGHLCSGFRWGYSMFGAGVSKKWSQIWTLVDERERGKNMPGTRLGESGFMRLQKVETKLF